MSAYYNEIDPYAAQWLRNLIEAGHIAPGVVDERSIEDVKPDELMGYTQCHFFAGVGVWSLALRRAGWPDNRPIWTGSCPCQPFSAAGAGAGFADPRHLWPSFAWLIKQCAPPVVIGEQVASKAVEPWVDLVQADLEALGYAFGAVPFPAASVGAPHIRDRLYWVADAASTGPLSGAHAGIYRSKKGVGPRYGEPERLGAACGLADAESERRAGQHLREGAGRPTLGTADISAFGGLADTVMQQRSGSAPGSDVPGGRDQEPAEIAGLDEFGGMADADEQQRDGCGNVGPGGRFESPECGGAGRPGPTNGHWRDADWLFCRDGKFRPVEPGTFQLAYGDTSRVGRLRAYGNAINAQAAQEFIAAYLESTQGN